MCWDLGSSHAYGVIIWLLTYPTPTQHVHAALERWGLVITHIIRVRLTVATGCPVANVNEFHTKNKPLPSSPLLSFHTIRALSLPLLTLEYIFQHRSLTSVTLTFSLALISSMPSVLPVSSPTSDLMRLCVRIPVSLAISLPFPSL